jgi:uncharacterized repeat protein (TIGR01451 family)
MLKKVYTLTIVLFFQSFLVFGQSQTKLDIALRHIEQNAEEWNLVSSDFANLQVSSEVHTGNGITYLYLNQSYENIPIRNAMITVVILPDGKVKSSSHSLISNVKSKVNKRTSALKPEQAILSSAEYLGIKVKSNPVSLSRNDHGKLSFEMPELTKSAIPAELKYDLIDDKLVLVWNLNLDMKTNSDYWDINIDANTGKFISKVNFTTYCKHHKDGFAKHDNCAISTVRSMNNNTQRVAQVLANRSATATYNVYKIPAESPNHGARSIAQDDQYPDVSPFGWHDINGVEGPEFMITRGNNVYAYQDKDDNDASDGMDTNGGAALNFDFPMDLSKDPRESADAALTNLFYMVNMMHDVTATLGFTEEFGNFQQKNYSGLPGGGDYVLAQAFDGITKHEAKEDLDANGNPTKINNANFSTPNDGSSGRMQMFFWNNEGGAVSIDAPEQIKGFISEYGAAQFGLPIPNATEPAIMGRVVIAKDGSTNPTNGCGNYINAAAMSGKIALIDRGICEFGKKVKNAQNAGAVAAIVCNIAGVNGGNGEELIGMAGGVDGPSVTIPSVFMKKSDCDKIKIIIANNVAVEMTFKARERVGAEYFDGALDNGIIAHEFGHGISNRLTGGRTNSSCLGNDEQMGEGWSDFFSLIMTHEPGDNGTDVRGIGTFATSQKPTSGGIRRYPYSTDMNINPQTFDDIKGTTAPHPLGEVWAGMLWDMYWAFVDLYGYDANWKNKESGNYKAAFLVIEGMKLQSCNPGFIQGRNAIFDADELFFQGRHKCMIWDVFARRGLGYFAEGGSTTNRNDGVENFEPLPTCIEKLKISKTATASVNAGDEVIIELKSINHVPSRKTNVIITDELPAGMTYVSGSSNITPSITGNLLTFDVGDMDYEKAINITYRVKTSINNKSVRLSFDDFEGNINWDIQKNKGNEDWLPNYDTYKSPEVSLYITNVAADVDASLISSPFTISGVNPTLRFWHRYNTQIGTDGGFVEISVNNGSFEVVKANKYIRNEPNGPIAYGTLAIPALDGFTGNSGPDWIDSYIDLSAYKGQSVKFKFRFGSDATVAATGNFPGWYIDDVEILDVYKYVAMACIGSDGGLNEKACTEGITTLINSGGTVGSEDVNNDYFSAQLYPNPAGEYVEVTAISPVNVLANIDLINIDGKVVLNAKMNIDRNGNRLTINTSGLPSGFYIVKIQSGSNLSTKKLIIK